MKRNLKLIILALCIAAVFPVNPARGTIASVLVTPANPTTLSNGLSYYLAGMPYNFSVQVIDPDITGWAQLTSIQVSIANGANPAIVVSITPSGTGIDLPVTVTGGPVDAVADILAPSTYNNCTVTFKVTFRWDTQESNFTSPSNITGTGITTNNISDTAVSSYGVCSSIKISNFVQTGVAADGMVNPYHDHFTITGTPVYNIPGATSLDAIEARDAGEINVSSNLLLYLNGAPTGIVSTGVLPALSFDIPVSRLNAAPGILGANTWQVRALMATAGGPESSNNSLIINCDDVEVTGITFVNGGGINLPAYYRSITLPGTEVVVSARMRNSLSGMVGDTTVRIYNSATGQSKNVLIPDGSNTGSAILPNPTGVGLPGSHGSVQNFYRAEEIIGGAHGGDVDLIPPVGPPVPVKQGQSIDSRITQPAVPASIYWENEYYPCTFTSPAVFTSWNGFSATAYSLTFNWVHVPNAAPNQDFYSYRVYYKESSATVYQLIDRNTSGYSALGNITTGTVTIMGLKPLTLYNYYITAIDVFGNEVPNGPPGPVNTQSLPGLHLGAPYYETVGTLASTIRVELTDGITTYNDENFTMPPATDNPLDRPLRKTAINVKVFIVAAGDLPDIVNIIVANNTTGALINALGNIQVAENVPAGYYRYTTLKTGTNEWSTYIPDTNPLIAVGTNVKLIIETIKNGVTSYADNNSETESPASANPNDYPYTFNINMQPVFKPWPTRVLNNVITSKNPVAYPAYYLTDDAYVSLIIYDIKGRPVKVLLDNTFRKGGMNIKEGGWTGDNKSRNKVGVGLYYMHFTAKRASDGKEILNSFQKVVMAK